MSPGTGESAAAEWSGAVEALRAAGVDAPEVLLVLGSGLGPLADAVEEPVVVPFGELPGYPSATVAGHAGRYLFGGLEGRRVLVQQGRFHLYEGHPLAVVAAPIRVAHALGTGVALLTNAVGGIRRDLSPGDIVVLDDHLNLQFQSPLAGRVVPGETRFPDMSSPYDVELRALVRRAAAELGLSLHDGVYAAVLGPSYETPAEVRMLARLGADVVGMSTVPEVLVARALNMRCLALSLVTNRAAGTAGQPLDHAEVVEVGRAAGARLEQLVRAVVRGLGQSAGAK